MVQRRRDMGPHRTTPYELGLIRIRTGTKKNFSHADEPLYLQFAKIRFLLHLGCYDSRLRITQIVLQAN
jgi:hypothetical protein